MLCAARPAAGSAAGNAADLEPPFVRSTKTLTGRKAQPTVPAQRQGPPYQVTGFCLWCGMHVDAQLVFPPTPVSPLRSSASTPHRLPGRSMESYSFCQALLTAPAALAVCGVTSS